MSDALPSPLWGGSIREAERGGGASASAGALSPPPPRLTSFAMQSLFADPPHKGEGEAP